MKEQEQGRNCLSQMRKRERRMVVDREEEHHDLGVGVLSWDVSG